MPSISLTRLRLRAWRYLPPFLPLAIRSTRQARSAPGYRTGALLADRHLAFWTLTIWDDEAAMRAYQLGGAHRIAMSKLADWCDEASVARWESLDDRLPDWAEADRRMRDTGRPSKVRYPTPAHATLTFAPSHPRGGTRLGKRRPPENR